MNKSKINNCRNPNLFSKKARKYAKLVFKKEDY